MDIYHIWCDLKPDQSDTDFADALSAFMARLKSEKKIESWRLTRCKLGLKPDHLAEWHIMIETENLAQLDEAFRTLAAKSGEPHTLHFGANQMVSNVRFGLYRDWPD